IDEFWRSLRDQPEFNEPGVVEELQFTLQMAALTDHHLPLVRKFQAMKRNNGRETLRDLAAWDEEQWFQMLSGGREKGPALVPPATPGKDDVEKARNYAAVLAGRIEAAFPTAVIADRISRDSSSQYADLSTFFANNQKFEFN